MSSALVEAGHLCGRATRRRLDQVGKNEWDRVQGNLQHKVNSVIQANYPVPIPVNLRVNTTHRHGSSNQSSTTEGVHTKPTQGNCHWVPLDTLQIRPHCQEQEKQQIFLTHRNKHRESAKMRQINMTQTKEQDKIPEKKSMKWRQTVYLIQS